MPTSAPPDVELEIYQHVLDGVLLAYTPLSSLLEAGNVIRYDRDESNADPDKQQKADGDYPELRAEMVGGSSTAWATDPTFGTQGEPTCTNWNEAQTHALRLTLTSTKLTLLESSPLRKFALNALRLAGPTLGLSYILKVSWRWSVTRQVSGDQDRTERQVVVIDLSLESLTEGRKLTGELP